MQSIDEEQWGYIDEEQWGCWMLAHLQEYVGQAHEAK